MGWDERGDDDELSSLSVMTVVATGDVDFLLSHKVVYLLGSRELVFRKKEGTESGEEGAPFRAGALRAVEERVSK